MNHARKNKLDDIVVSAIDQAVKQALDEKLQGAEHEIVEKVVHRLDHGWHPVVTQDSHPMFNPLGGP